MANAENAMLDLDQQGQLVTRLDESMKPLALVFGEECQTIPVQVLTPKELGEILEPGKATTLKDILKRVEGNGEVRPFDLALLLDICAPRYFHPGPRVLFTWAPDLAIRLTRLFPRQRTTIVNSLAPSEQEVAAVIAHEKYGHGYLYLETTLGRQLAHILADNELYRAVVTYDKPLFLNSPWKHAFFEKNKAWLPYLLGSVVVVEEGFAGWVQTKLLLCIGGRFASYAAYKLTRHPFNVPFKGLIPFMPYFRARGYSLLSERLFSPHKQGYDWIDEIYEMLGYTCMPCVLQVVQMAMDIDFGIARDQAGVIQVAIQPSDMERYLKDGEPEFYLADQRLVALRNILLDNIRELEAVRQSWSCQASGPCEVPENRSCESFLRQLMLQLPNWLKGKAPQGQDVHIEPQEHTLIEKEESHGGQVSQWVEHTKSDAALGCG